MRIVIERRLELPDQGTTERRIEVEIADLGVPETVLLVQKLAGAVEGPNNDGELQRRVTELEHFVQPVR